MLLYTAEVWRRENNMDGIAAYIEDADVSFRGRRKIKEFC